MTVSAAVWLDCRGGVKGAIVATHFRSPVFKSSAEMPLRVPSLRLLIVWWPRQN